MKKRGVEWSEVTCTPSALSIQIQLCFSPFLIILLRVKMSSYFDNLLLVL